MTTRKVLSYAAPAALVVLAATLSVLASACSHPTEAAAQAAVKQKPVHVETVAVDERAVPKTVLLAGSLKANQESDLAANAVGRVVRTMVERGSFVRQGATVAQLDTRLSTLAAAEAHANLETARAQKTLAEQDCSRYQRLLDKGAISQQEFDKATSACKTTAEGAAAAESRAQQAAQTLGDATIRAPFAGLVAERYISAGEYVHADTKVVHLVDIDPLRLELTIPEANMGAVKTGQSVQFQVAAFPDRSFTGVVRYVGPAVRATTRDLVFEAVVPNPQHELRPGLFATARLDAGTEPLPVVPKAALRQDGDTVRTFVVVADATGARGRRLEERVVQTGPALGELVALRAGVRTGERVVTRVTDQLTDGQPVE